MQLLRQERGDGDGHGAGGEAGEPMMHVTDSGMYPDGKSFWNLECPRGHKRTVIQRAAPVRLCECERPVKPEQPKLFGGAND